MSVQMPKVVLLWGDGEIEAVWRAHCIFEQDSTVKNVSIEFADGRHSFLLTRELVEKSLRNSSLLIARVQELRKNGLAVPSVC